MNANVIAFDENEIAELSASEASDVSGSVFLGPAMMVFVVGLVIYEIVTY